MDRKVFFALIALSAMFMVSINIFRFDYLFTSIANAASGFFIILIAWLLFIGKRYPTIKEQESIRDSEKALHDLISIYRQNGYMWINYNLLEPCRQINDEGIGLWYSPAALLRDMGENPFVSPHPLRATELVNILRQKHIFNKSFKVIIVVSSKNRLVYELVPEDVVRGLVSLMEGNTFKDDYLYRLH